VSDLQKRTVNLYRLQFLQTSYHCCHAKNCQPQSSLQLQKNFCPTWEQAFFRMNTRYILLTVWMEYSDVPQKIMILQK